MEFPHCDDQIFKIQYVNNRITTRSTFHVSVAPSLIFHAHDNRLLRALLAQHGSLRHTNERVSSQSNQSRPKGKETLHRNKDRGREGKGTMEKKGKNSPDNPPA